MISCDASLMCPSHPLYVDPKDRDGSEVAGRVEIDCLHAPEDVRVKANGIVTFRCACYGAAGVPTEPVVEAKVEKLPEDRIVQEIPDDDDA